MTESHSCVCVLLYPYRQMSSKSFGIPINAGGFQTLPLTLIRLALLDVLCWCAGTSAFFPLPLWSKKLSAASMVRGSIIQLSLTSALRYLVMLSQPQPTSKVPGPSSSELSMQASLSMVPVGYHLDYRGLCKHTYNSKVLLSNGATSHWDMETWHHLSDSAA